MQKVLKDIPFLSYQFSSRDFRNEHARRAFLASTHVSVAALQLTYVRLCNRLPVNSVTDSFSLPQDKKKIAENSSSALRSIPTIMSE
ncbi:hypothetical protein J6590_106479, partial [Homalodisca vitripennis]